MASTESFVETKQAAAVWGSHAITYASITQAFTRNGAEGLVDYVQRSAKPIDSSSSVLDVGAGTGMLALYVAKKFPQTPVLATDIAPPMLAQIDSQNVPNVSTMVADAGSLAKSVGEGQYTHALSTFMLQFVPDQDGAVSEMYASLKPGGLAGIGIWGPRMDSQDIWTKACQMIDPTYRLPALFGAPGAWGTPGELTEGMKRAGFQDVAYEISSARMPVQSAEQWAEFWFDTEHPAIWGIISTWKGDLAEVRKNLIQITKDEYKDAEDMVVTYTLATGVKKS